MERRKVEVVVMSDLHVGTIGCHAREIANYLKSIQPGILILNGDIIDGWQFNKRYFPPAHIAVLKEIMELLDNGVRVIYITGNHDEMLRSYSGMRLGNLELTDKVVMDINGKVTWIFHGDVFDATTNGSTKLLAKLGGHGYDLLIYMNCFVNWCLKAMGRQKMSFSKKVKNSVKKAVAWISDFEQTAAALAIENNYDYVVCGHIHQPQKRVIETKKGSVVYLNSGDWIENLTCLEYNNSEWNIYHYDEKEFASVPPAHLKKQLPKLNVVTHEVELYNSPGNVISGNFNLATLLKRASSGTQ